MSTKTIFQIAIGATWYREFKMTFLDVALF